MDSGLCCLFCGKIFSRPDSKKRHERICKFKHHILSSRKERNHSANIFFQCKSCSRRFTRNDNCKRHEKFCTTPHELPQEIPFESAVDDSISCHLCTLCKNDPCLCSTDSNCKNESLCYKCGILFATQNLVDTHKCDAVASTSSQQQGCRDDFIENSMDLEEVIPLICSRCGQSFLTPEDREIHENNICTLRHQVGLCSKCGSVFSNYHNLQRHEENCSLFQIPLRKVEPKKKEVLALPSNIDEYETAFEGRIKSFFLRSENNFDLNSFLNNIKPKIFNKISGLFQNYNSLKINFFVECFFKNQHNESTDRAFKTNNKDLCRDSDISELIENSFTELKQELEESNLQKSG